jgi:hypothetical protein
VRRTPVDALWESGRAFNHRKADFQALAAHKAIIGGPKGAPAGDYIRMLVLNADDLILVI